MQKLLKGLHALLGSKLLPASDQRVQYQNHGDESGISGVPHQKRDEASHAENVDERALKLVENDGEERHRLASGQRILAMLLKAPAGLF